MTFLPVVRIARDEQLADLRLVLGQARFLGAHLGREERTHLGVRLAVEHLARLGEVLPGAAVVAVHLDDRAQLGQPAARGRRRLLVAGRVELGELRFQLLQFGLEIGQPFEHVDQGTG